MQLLRRLTLVDLTLIAALLLTAILWVNSRADPAPDSAAINQNLDRPAWDQVNELLANAVADRSLGGVQSALASAAEIAAAAGDSASANLIRSLSASLTSVDLNAVEQALSTLGAVPANSLFVDLFFTLWGPLYSPPIPIGSPAISAEWAQINVITPDLPIAQFWGTTIWKLPDDIPESAGEADIAIPDLGLDAKLMFAISGDDILMTLVFIGPLDDTAIINAIGFWVTTDGERTIITGEPLLAGEGVVQMTLSPQAREENIDLLQTADEIGLVADFPGNRRYVLRIELGDTGRALLHTTLGGL